MTAHLGAQNVIDGEREALAGIVRQDEAVVFRSDDRELFHAVLPPQLRSNAIVPRHGRTAGNAEGAPPVPSLAQRVSA